MSLRWLPYLSTRRVLAIYGRNSFLDPRSGWISDWLEHHAGQAEETGARSDDALIERSLLIMLVLSVGLVLLTLQLDRDLGKADQTLHQAHVEVADLLLSTQKMEKLVENLHAMASLSSAPAAASLAAPAAQIVDQAEEAGSVEPRLTRQEIEEIVRGAAAQHGLPFSWLAAQITVESGWDPTAISPTSDYGLAQIHLSAHKITPEEAFNPEFAADWMAGTMARYFRRYGTFREALRRYQCGEEGARHFDCGAGYAQKVLSLIPD